MSDSKINKKLVLEIFKMMNVGVILAVTVVVAITGFMYGSGCGPVVPSRSWSDSSLILGMPTLEDHPEEIRAGDSAP